MRPKLKHVSRSLVVINFLLNLFILYSLYHLWDKVNWQEQVQENVIESIFE